MRWTNLSLALLATGASLVAAPSLAETRETTSKTPVQVEREVKDNAGHALESLREEMKHSQTETEARISATLVDPLRQQITVLAERANDTASRQYVQVATSLGACISLLAAIVGAWVSYKFGRRAARQDSARADNEKIFSRVSFPTVKSSLQGNLKRQTNVANTAETMVGNIMRTSLVKPGDTKDLDERAIMNEARSVRVTPVQLSLPEEGQHRTKALAALLSEHESREQKLNDSLQAFFVLLQLVSVYEKRDEQLWAKYKADDILALRKSKQFHHDLEAACKAVTIAAENLKSSALSVDNELENVEKIIKNL